LRPELPETVKRGASRAFRPKTDTISFQIAFCLPGYLNRAGFGMLSTYGAVSWLSMEYLIFKSPNITALKQSRLETKSSLNILMFFHI
jgi:hypothetical protein